ncbi:MAG: methyltransferase domain-containing protein [Anaerolineales bacterium]|nr:methyltransferase domain-containing protein [Anaerolineales bacterium]
MTVLTPKNITLSHLSDSQNSSVRRSLGQASTTPSEPIQFVCPDCHSPLLRQPESWSCSGCQENFPVQLHLIGDNEVAIPDFASRAFAWNFVPPAEMEELLQLTRSAGWRTAIDQVMQRLHGVGPVATVLNTGRANGVLKANPCDKNGQPKPLSACRVLEIGSGYGAITAGLAAHCGEVVAVDATAELLEFVALRTTQEGFTNVTFAHIDPLDFNRLPFARETFDLIVLNGVLEYVGTADEGRDPYEVQLATLIHLRNLLQPGGQIFIGIENRLSGFSFLGMRDHSGFPFTNLMPRRLADLTTRLLLRFPYRTYTYSRRGYETLLRTAGLPASRFYLPIPSYRQPDVILDATNRVEIRNWINHELDNQQVFGLLPSRVKTAVVGNRLLFKAIVMLIGILHRFRLETLLWPSYGIVAGRSVG